MDLVHAIHVLDAHDIVPDGRCGGLASSLATMMMVDGVESRQGFGSLLPGEPPSSAPATTRAARRDCHTTHTSYSMKCRRDRALEREDC